MPFTPFHFGPGLALKAFFGRRLSFAMFGLVQVLTDVEVLVHLTERRPRLHGFFRTYVGATALALGTTVVVGSLLVGIRRLRRRAPEEGARPLLPMFFASALVGTWSHVALDSIMHRDMIPFEPFLEGNALLGVVSLVWLHVACIMLGAIGLYALFVKSSYESVGR